MSAIVALVVLEVAALHGHVCAQNIESQPFISPKGPYVTEQESYHTYRIPGMVVAADGSILTFAEGRRGDGSDPRRDDNAPMDLVMRRSTDGGLTWENQVVLDSGFKSNGAKVDFGDPTPVLDQTTGDIFLFYGQWPDFGSIDSNWGQDPNAALGNQTLWMQSSANHGMSWSGPTQILYPDEPGETSDGKYWRFVEPGPGSGIQLNWQDNNPTRNGRLVIPVKRGASTTPDGSTERKGLTIYSDDHGASWQFGNNASAGGNENEVVELIDGNLLLDARAVPRTRFTSSDGGHSWSDAPSSDVPVPAVDASLIRLSARRDGDARNRLLFSGSGGSPVGAGNSRNNLLVWSSYDEGQTFINPVQMNNEFAAYSVLAELQDGRIGLLVESAGDETFNLGQSYGDITFYNFGTARLDGDYMPDVLTHFDGWGNTIDAFRGGVGFSGSWAENNVDIVNGGLEYAQFELFNDQQRAHFRGGDMTRNLATPIDLDANATYYMSLFVRQDDDGFSGASGEWLDIRLLDGSSQQFAFGVVSSEAFFVRNEDAGSNMLTPADSMVPDTDYLLLAKIEAQDSSPGSFDQIFLAIYDDPTAVPEDEGDINWTLAGLTNDNFNGSIDTIFVGGGVNADWNVDGLRIADGFAGAIVDNGLTGVAGDINQDGILDMLDRDAFVMHWRSAGHETLSEMITHGDFTRDGLTSLPDAFVLHQAFQDAGFNISFADLFVPEPSFVCGMLGGLLLIRRQRPRRASPSAEA